MSHLDILACAICHELLLVLRLNHNGHSLLRLADSQLSRIKTAIFYRNPVKIYVKSVGKLTDGNAHSAGTEVIGLLDKTGNLRTSEKPLDLPFLRCITLLNLTAAALKGSLGVLLRRTSCTADTVTSGTASQKKHHIARSRTLPAYAVSLHGTYDSTYLKPLCKVAVMVNLTDMSGCKADLVAVA